MEWLRYTIAALVSAVAVFLTLWAADTVGTMWAGLIASIPVTFFIMLIFLGDEQLGSFTFYFAWGKFAYFITLLFTVYMIYVLALNKVAIGFLAFSIWLLVLGILYWYFHTHGW